MKIVSVAEEDTNIMLGLLGIEGIVIESQTKKGFQEEFDKILEDKSIGVILLNEKYFIRYKNYFKSKKIQKQPLIVEIPDFKAALDDNYFQSLVEKIVGISL